MIALLKRARKHLNTCSKRASPSPSIREKEKNNVSTQYSVSLVSEISNSKTWANSLTEVVVETPFLALK